MAYDRIALMTNMAKFAILAVIIALLGGGYYFTKNKSVSNITSPEPQTEVVTNPPPAPSENKTLPPPPVSSPKNISAPKPVFPNAVQSPDPSLPSTGPVITTKALPSARTNESYNVFVTASGGGKAYTWKVIAGTIPPGLTGIQSLNCGTFKNQECHPSFQISGIPAKEGIYSIRIAVYDGAIAVYKDFSINIERGVSLIITTVSLPEASLGANYDAEIYGAGGSGPYSWSTADTLPPDLSLVPLLCQEAFCPAKAKIIGTPRGLGSRTFTIILSSGNETVSKEFTITVK